MKVQRRKGVRHIYSDTPPTPKKLGLIIGDVWHVPDGCVYRWERTYWHPVKLRTKPSLDKLDA